MERETTPEYAVVKIGCFSQGSCNGPILQHRLRWTSELDSIGFLMRVNFHFWEFGEVWEVFAK
jgi:hypothetical protein